MVFVSRRVKVRRRKEKCLLLAAVGNKRRATRMMR